MEDSKTVVDTTKTSADAERLAKLETENEKFKNEIREMASKRDELKSKRDELQGKLKEIEDGKLMADGKTKELLDAKIKEFEDLNSKFTDVKAKADEYENYKKTKRDGLLAEIKDEELKSIAEDLSLDKLEIFVKKNKGTKTPDVDGGSAGGKFTLTDAQKAEAKLMNLSESDYYEVQSNRKIKKEQ
jgi:predicted RNase H-like nuclease (RuvC/YqgF family)